MAATEERLALAQLGEQQGWTIRESGRTDVYHRGTFRIRVIWHGDSAISGASQNNEEGLAAYTRDLANVRTWLKK